MTRSALASALSLLTLLALSIAPDAGASPGWRWPVEGEVLTSYRNGDDPYARGQHRGIDIAAPPGTRVAAATAGVVTFAGIAGDSGVTVSVRTADGTFDTSYLHLAGASVRRGEPVSAGDAIGTVGTTGRRSAEEPHLHFGVREAGSRHGYRDPLTLLPPPAAPSERPASPRPVPVALPEPLAPTTVPAPPVTAAPAPAPALAPLPALAGAISATAAGPAAAAIRAVSAGPVPAAGPILAAGRALAAGPARAPAGTPVSGQAVRALAPAAAPAPAAGIRPPRAAATATASAEPSTRRSASPSRGAPHPAPPPSLGAAPGASQDAAAARPDVRHRAAASAAAPEVRAPGRGDSAFDLGWLAACAGLVAAAGLLGRPRGPFGSLRRGRAFVAASSRSGGPGARARTHA